ncbi:MAG: tail fiber domain-containing protein [Armatimonadetes bacterium]|nr:tail fiber domain-containing protein [Armatimonadota bacterium]
MPTDFDPNYVVIDDVIEPEHVNDLRDAVNALEKGASFFAAASGSGAYAVSFIDPFTAYSAGMLVNFQAANANSGAVTLNVDGLGAKSVVKPGGAALSAGEIAAGQAVAVIFDATNDRFQVVGGIAAGPASLSSLNDVEVSSPAAGKILRHDGTQFVDVSLDTGIVPEGSNLYHTAARARNSMSAAPPLLYNAETGQFSTDIIPAEKGGTGQSVYTAGDLLHATGSSSLAKLPIGLTGQVLKVVAGAPAWADESGGGGAQSLDDLTDVAVSAPVAGHILRHDGTTGFVNQALDTGIVPEAGNLYHTDARVRNALSAQAPLAYNAGTGQFSMPQAGASQSGHLSSSDWTTFNNKANASHGHVPGDITGIFGVSQGGTGLASFAAGDMVYATGAAVLAALGIGSPGDVLRVNGAGTAPEWGPNSGGSGVILAARQPEIVSVATGASGASNVTSHPITMPSNIQKGDLLIVFFSSDGGVFSSCAGWSKAREGSQGANVTGAVFYKVAQGGDTATVVTSAAEQSSHIVYQVRLWPGWSRVLAADAASGASGNADPPSLSFGATASGLVIASRHGDATEVASGAPAGYSNLQTSTAAGAGGASTNTAVKFVASVGSENPGAFSGDGVEQWAAFTVLIPALPWDAGSLETPPGTGANDAAYGSIAWSNPENILASDNSRASMTASGTTASNYLKASNFGLSIPDGATILSLTVGIEVLRNGGTTGHIVDDTVKLAIGGSVVGNNLAVGSNWPTSDTLRLYGGALSTWGVSPTPAELNASDFGVVLSARGQAAGHDRVANVDRIFVLANYVLARTEALPYSGDLSDIASVSVVKGTLLAGSADGWQGLPVGADEQLLVADSAEPKGVKWSALPAHQHDAGDLTSGILGAARGGTGIGSYITGNYLRAASSSALEERTPAQVLTDIGASAVGHTHDASAIATGLLQVIQGGTGLGAAALGDILYSNAANSMARLAGNTTTARKFLSQTGTGSASAAPSWEPLQVGDLPAHTHSAADIATGQLGTDRGGTGLGFYVAGDMLYAPAANTLARLSAGSNGQVLTMTAGVPSWQAPSGSLDGAGSATALAYWSDANTLTYDSAITRTGAGVLRANTRLEAGQLSVTSINGIDTTGAFDLYLKRNAIEVARFVSDRTYLRKVRNASGGYNLYWGGTNTDEIVWLASRRAHKQDVADLQLTMDDLMGWRPVQYQWRAAFGGDQDVGLIAEEMADVFPRVVIRDRDWVYTDPETGDYEKSSEGGPRTLPGTSVPTGIKYDRAWVALLAGVQDFYRNYRASVQDLRQLETRMAALEARFTS